MEYKLEILGESPRTSKDIRVVAKCICGNIKTYNKYNIGKTTNSCGCKPSRGTVTHGMCKSKIYNTWAALIKRCTNPRDEKYKRYGERGITVCNRWMKFENFYADMGDQPEGKQIDRIDNNKGYSRGNCRWATAKENTNNRENSIKVDLGYFQLTLSELADLSRMTYYAMNNRWHKYGNAWDCLFPPIRKP